MDSCTIHSAFGASSEVASLNLESGTEPSLTVNCFFTRMKQPQLLWLNKSVMLHLCDIHGGRAFKDPDPANFSLLTRSFCPVKTPSILLLLSWIFCTNRKVSSRKSHRACRSSRPYLGLPLFRFTLFRSLRKKN